MEETDRSGLLCSGFAWLPNGCRTTELHSQRCAFILRSNDCLINDISIKGAWMTDPVFSHSDQYETYAQHCLSVATHTPDRASRLILREMAAEWLNLAAALVHDGRQPGNGRAVDGAQPGD
jgi:hypothetical protein